MSPDSKLIAWIGAVAIIVAAAIIIGLPRLISRSTPPDALSLGSTAMETGRAATQPKPQRAGDAKSPSSVTSEITPVRSTTPLRAAPDKRSVAEPTRKVFREDVSDKFLKTLVKVCIVVPRQTSPDGFRTILRKEYNRVAAKPVSSIYRTRPSQVMVRAYTSEEAAAASEGQHVAMVLGSPPQEPILDVDERMLAAQNLPAVIKFGRTERERRAIWEQRSAASRRAREEAEKLFPLNGPAAPATSAQLDANFAVREKLNLRYERELADKHGLSIEQLREIVSEAIDKGWTPVPYCGTQPSSRSSRLRTSVSVCFGARLTYSSAIFLHSCGSERIC